VRLGRTEIVKLLLAEGCDPDVRNDDQSGYRDETALLGAAFWGRLEIARLLIDHGAKVTARAERGITPLHEAARMGHAELARLLLARGADVNAADDEGATPLDWVGSNGPSAEMVRLLRSHGGRDKAAKP
jgi:ankyrin repeat protein